MADERTQDALDALADLFLTGLMPAPASEVETERAKRRARRRSPEERLDGPSPIRLQPKVPSPAAAAANAVPTSRSANAPVSVDAMLPDPLEVLDKAAGHLASATQQLDTPAPYLRLHREIDEAITSAPSSGTVASATAASAPADAPAPIVALEAVLLGNLPGLAGAWVTQYAGLLAQQEGPVAVLHVDDEGVDLQLVEPFDNPQPADELPLVDDAVALLDAMVRRTDLPVRTVLVHHDVAAAQPGLSRLLAVDNWTMLCGADDAAVVSVHHALKNLVDADAAAATKRVGLMVMGSEEAESRAAADRVRAAAAEFLASPVQLVGWQKRMVPVTARDLASFADVAVTWPRIQAWLGTLATPPVETRDEPQPVAPPKPVYQPQAESATTRTPERKPAVTPASTAPAASAMPQKRRSSIFTGPAAPAPQRPSLPPRQTPTPRPIPAMPAAARPKPRPAPAVAASTKPQPEPANWRTPAAPLGTPASVGVSPAPASATLSAPDLAALAAPSNIPGGVAMEARCPHLPAIQLVLDQSGRLHLLARATPTLHGLADKGATAKDVGVEALRSAIVDLMEARGWVREHLQLLQLTQRQMRLDGEALPALHLFTDRADLAVPLANRLGNVLKLHLLQEVRVGAQATWFCTPLC